MQPSHTRARPARTLTLAVLVVALAGVCLLTRFLAGTAQAAPAGERPAQGVARSPVADIAATPSYTVHLPLINVPPEPPPISGPCPAISGWRGLYWNNGALGGAPMLCRDDVNVAFNWGTAPPDPLLPADHFSARWTRSLSLAAGHYRFHLAGDDGLRLWVDGKLGVEAWAVQARTEYTAEMDLLQGEHNIRVEYFEGTGNADISLWWEGPGGSCAGLWAEYFDNMTLSGNPVFSQCEGWVIDHNWGQAGPGPGLPVDGFSVRWTGQSHLGGGLYTFDAVTDDGLRAWANTTVLLDAWQDQGPTAYRATRNLDAGDYEIKVEYYEKTGTALAQLWWEHRTLPPGVVISQGQGFDTCAVPSSSSLATWWNASPYLEVNLYIGGVLRACRQDNLTAQGLRTAHAQGWNFIPTWVGPQAPCSLYGRRMSTDPAVAYGEGRSEADAAAAAAVALGLPALGGQAGSSIVYYDVEYYAGDTACRNAVKSFMSGWVSRLHELGMRAGGYGSPCAYMPDWAAAANVPDDVWVAWWNSSGFNPGASVWNLLCLPNSLWPEHQRIHQYAGDHNETWGGLTLNIDSDVLDGHVAGDNWRPISPATALGATPLSTPMPEGAAGAVAVSPADIGTAGVDAVELLPSGEGWALAGRRLLWSVDGGGQWRDATPAMAGQAGVRAAHFLDAQHGWALAPAADEGGARGLTVVRTADGGRTWSAATLPGQTGSEAYLSQSSGYLDFVDTSYGWLALKLPAGSNFSRGMLYATQDGGETWTQLALPAGGPVRFSDRATGWLAGGPAGDELYVTRDGGQSWERQAPGTDAEPARRYTLPVFADAEHGWLAVSSGESGDSQVQVFSTGDGGRSWKLASTRPFSSDSPSARPEVALEGTSGDFLVLDPSGGRLWRVPASGYSAADALGSALPQGVIDLQFDARGQGWAVVQAGSCTGDKGRLGEPDNEFRCQFRRSLMRTADGGRTWIDVSP